MNALDSLLVDAHIAAYPREPEEPGAIEANVRAWTTKDLPDGWEGIPVCVAAVNDFVRDVAGRINERGKSPP